MAYLHNAGYNYGGNLSTGIQQRTAKAAGPALVDGGQLKVGGASGPNVRQSTHWEIQRRLGCSALCPYDEKKYRGAGLREVQTWWKTCKDWMARYKTHSEPFIYDIKKLLKALSDKEAVAQSEVDAFMENCARRWQTREGTYQLKRRRLPDVRDLPEYTDADIDMEDI